MGEALRNRSKDFRQTMREDVILIKAVSVSDCRKYTRFTLQYMFHLTHLDYRHPSYIHSLPCYPTPLQTRQLSERSSPKAKLMKPATQPPPLFRTVNIVITPANSHIPLSIAIITKKITRSLVCPLRAARFAHRFLAAPSAGTAPLLVVPLHDPVPPMPFHDDPRQNGGERGEKRGRHEDKPGLEVRGSNVGCGVGDWGFGNLAFSV